MIGFQNFHLIIQMMIKVNQVMMFLFWIVLCQIHAILIKRVD